MLGAGSQTVVTSSAWTPPVQVMPCTIGGTFGCAACCSAKACSAFAVHSLVGDDSPLCFVRSQATAQRAEVPHVTMLHCPLQFKKHWACQLLLRIARTPLQGRLRLSHAQTNGCCTGGRTQAYLQEPCRLITQIVY